MTDAEFRGALKALGMSQSAFARTLMELGDPRSFTTVLRSVSNYARGETGVPASVVVSLNLMKRGRIKPKAVRKPGRPRKIVC